ncbi:lysoplasmalogenase [Pseudothermotoga sp.]|uniref:lysoplasmalogenase n=1 Tax=Pseudothermotoga sp. TaxID=2033661 RepID=UPI0031F66F23
MILKKCVLLVLFLCVISLTMFSHTAGSGRQRSIVYADAQNYMFFIRPQPNTVDFEKAEIRTAFYGKESHMKVGSFKFKIILMLAFSTFLLMVVTIALKNRSKNCVFFKALTTICIIFIALLNSSGSEWFILAGLIFSLAGDIFLEFERHFLHGMLAFFITHVLYSAGFVKLFGIPNWWTFAGVYSIVLFQYFFLKAHLGRFKLTVLLYSLAIATMFSLSFGAMESDIYPLRTLLPIGAALFVLSDSCIAWDKFVRRLPLRNFLVLFTYFTGQLFIVLSIVS